MLGDKVEEALTILGITPDRVSKWLGVPCNCDERRDKLNALESWARRIVSGKIQKAREYLDNLLQEN